MTELKIGDTVKLKCGGPTMVVTYVDEGLVGCRYWDGGVLASEALPAGALQKVQAPPLE